MFKVRASRILSFEGSVTNSRKILHFVQDKLCTLEKWSGTFCAEHPTGRSGKRYLTPFPDPLTRPFALGLAVFIAIAMLKSHWGHGFFLARRPGEASGIEYTLALFLIAMALLIDGGGAFSVDRLLSR
jgi:hypothetical protein